jgi:hypothetical protein
LDEIAVLLEMYKDDPFVSRRDKHGVNCTALAAMEGHSEMIRFLHSKGRELNNIDRRGRTPLMEAALWGRLTVVNCLLELGVDPSAKDRKGCGAYHYTRASGRMTRLRRNFKLHRESSEDESNRRIIGVILQAFESVVAAETASAASYKPGGLCLTTESDLGIQIGYYELKTIYDVPSGYKTVARLDRG